MRALLFLGWILYGVAEMCAATLKHDIAGFVERYCLECHDATTAKGDRNFEPFLKNPAAPGHFEALREMLDQLNLGEMPPKKKNARQPADAERLGIIAEITRHLGEIEVEARPTATVMRRLTRYEYNHTIRDLLGVDTAAADRTRQFPADDRVHGFATLASAQSMSDHQLELYLAAARQYLDLALVFGREKPEARSWTFKPGDLNGEMHNPGSVRYRVWGKDRAWLDIAHGQPVENGPTYPKAFARTGVPADGHYRIRVAATAIGRRHPYDPAIFPNDLTVPLQLGLWHVPDASFLGKRVSEGRVMIGVYELPDDRTESIEATVWMPAGSVPFVHWINGPGASKAIMRKLTERYHPEAERKSQTKVDRLREQGLPVPEDALVQKVWISDVYQGPRIRVFEMTLEGPINDEWPPASHRNLVGAETDVRKLDLPKILTAFASKAFRRPVATSEIAHHIDHFKRQLAIGFPPEEVVKQGLSAILASPRFLYLDEGDTAESPWLDNHQLACRLSYALWCSMPDDRLMDLAAKGKLASPETLASEVGRLLDDPRSTAFVEHFADAWLQLHRLGSMPPGGKQFPAYYRDRLESAMKTETRLFIADALRRNLPVRHLLAARETFVNGALARHYGLTGVEGNEFRRVALPAHARRAGLLGHASVLTATANGVETSPVVRGIWVLESILGTPPPPPPPDVPKIEPDTRGTTTIREQLARHRSDAACAGCHARIDPWGFALEGYDPIGGRRARYPKDGRAGNGPAIDSSAELPDGHRIADESGLRDYLIRRSDLVLRNLIRQLLVNCAGRETRFADRGEIESMAKGVESRGGGLRDIVIAVATSDAFRRR